MSTQAEKDLPDEIKFRAPEGTKERLRAIARAKSQHGHRQLTISDEVRLAVSKHIGKQNGKAKPA